MRHYYKSRLIVSSEDILMAFLLMEVCVVEWMNLAKYYNLLIDLVVILYLCIHSKQIRKMQTAMVPFFLFLLYCIFQIVRPNTHIKVFLANIFHIITPVFIIFVLCLISCNKAKAESLFLRLFPFINGYMIINVPVLLLQLNNHFEFSGRHSIESTNYFKPDLISGLFGYNGTPMLGVFSAFFFVYNLWYYRHFIQTKWKRFFSVYYLLMFVFYVFISIKNENNAYFIVLGLFMLLYLFCMHNNYRRFTQRVVRNIKILLALAVLIIAGFIAYNTIPQLNKIINMYIRNYTVGTTTYYSGGSTDRFSMIYYFFTQNINKLFGVGIGAMKWREEFGFGFIHFGQSDLGSFLLIGGLALVALIIIMFASCIRTVNRSKFIVFFECSIFVILCVYTQLFTCTSIIISFMLVILVCNLERELSGKAKGEFLFAGVQP